VKTYFIDDLHDWLHELLPDLISELLKPSETVGYVYVPYIPLYVSPPLLDPNNTAPKGTRGRYAKTILSNFSSPPTFYSSIKVSNLDVPTDMPVIEQPRCPVIKLDRLMENLLSFIQTRPDEVPTSFTSTTPSIQKTLVERSLSELVRVGILRYDDGQDGWWKPDILEALAALPDGPTP
jgi:hypothetical protein